MKINIDSATFDLKDINLIKFHSINEEKCSVIFTFSSNKNIKVSNFDIKRFNILADKIKEDFVKIKMIDNQVTLDTLMSNTKESFYYINRDKVLTIEKRNENNAIRFLFKNGYCITINLTNSESLTYQMILFEFYGDDIFYV